MPTTNYLNPASMAPAIGWQPKGAQAGRIWSERNQDYDTMMRNQMLLQDMATRENAIGLYNKMQDVPLQDATRQDKMTTMDATRPFLGELATTGAQKTIGENRFSSEVTNGPEARKAKISELISSVDKNTSEQFGRELGMSVQIMERMQAMEKAQPGSGLAWAKQVVAEKNKQGYNIDPLITDPRVVQVMYPHMVETNLEFQRQKKQQEQKDLAAKERNDADNRTRIQAANIQASATRDAAATRSTNASKKRPKNIQESAFMAVDEAKEAAKEFGVDSEEYKQSASIAEDQLRAAFLSSPAGRNSMATIYEDPKNLRKSSEEKKAMLDDAALTWARQAMGRGGSSSPAAKPTPREQPGNSAKPDPLGLR